MVFLQTFAPARSGKRFFGHLFQLCFNTASSEVTPAEDCKVRPWQETQPHVPAESKPNPGAQEPPSLTLTLRSGEVDPTELGTLACQS